MISSAGRCDRRVIYNRNIHLGRSLLFSPLPCAKSEISDFFKKALAFERNLWYHIEVDTTHGRLAQLVEHLLDVQEVTGSSPVPSTIQFVLEPDSLRKRVRVRFLFIGGFAERVRRAVNEQRQGIIVAMVSCLLLCRIKFALCELGRSPIWLTGGNRYVRAYREPVHLWQGVTH